jgi:inhibitor of KinA
MRSAPVPPVDASGLRVRPAGDAALVLELPARMDESTSAQAIAIAQAVTKRFRHALRDVVVAYHTVTVYFDPLSTDAAWLETELLKTGQQTGGLEPASVARIDVPVCYGADLGPDLADVAAMVGWSEREVVASHTSREYRVFMIGFVPGFAYMGALDPRLATVGRRATPRTRLPAGSVAIAGGQTAIYPMETPGGWQILGRTPLRPFDAGRTPPALFSPGDRVRFYAIERAEFDRQVAAWLP